IIAGMGELHLEILVNRLRREQKLEVEVGPPRVAYRQTLAKKIQLEARHVKQSGGHGQFGVVRMNIGPIVGGDGSITFEETISGGSIPKEYFKSVERGVREICERGDETGFPFVNVEAELYDGKYHAVDSSDLAFQAAGRLAMRMAVDKAGSTILEPLMKLEIVCPDQYSSAVIGDLNSRRAEVHEIEQDGELRVIRGKIPIAEMFAYSTTLRSMTQGRGTYSLEMAEYAPVPRQIATKVREAAVKRRAQKVN
ncbi:MAG: translation factor GTPase family protein, partial [Planctomycetota bacterium]